MAVRTSGQASQCLNRLSPNKVSEYTVFRVIPLSPLVSSVLLVTGAVCSAVLVWYRGI